MVLCLEHKTLQLGAGKIIPPIQQEIYLYNFLLENLRLLDQMRLKFYLI